MVNMTGWTWDQVRDQLDLPRVELLREQWQHNPPLAVTMRLAAETLGVEFNGSKLLGRAPSQSGSETTEFNPLGLMAELGQSEPRPYVLPQMSMPVAATN